MPSNRGRSETQHGRLMRGRLLSVTAVAIAVVTAAAPAAAAPTTGHKPGPGFDWPAPALWPVSNDASLAFRMIMSNRTRVGADPRVWIP
jgi:hypothetical protein